MIIFDRVNENKERITLKDKVTFEEFAKALRVFNRDPQYNEMLTDADCKAEYDTYSNNETGILLGAYLNDQIAGVNCISYGNHKEHSIEFPDPSKVAYYAGLAVLEEARRRHIGDLLVVQTQALLEELNKKGLHKLDYSYARLLCRESQSEPIFKKYGFATAFDADGQLIADTVRYQDKFNQEHVDNRMYVVRSIKKEYRRRS